MKLKKAVLSAVSTEGAPRDRPDLSEVHYDIWTLRLTLNFESLSGVVYVDFPSVDGFRVLDEGDLLEMWPAKAGWLYTVDSGGWLSQESARPGFVTDPESVTEYLLAGQNDCVSVLALEEPVVTVHDYGD